MLSTAFNINLGTHCLPGCILEVHYISFFLLLRFDNAYITWINDGQKAWTLYSGAVAADPRVEISARPVPQEPMVRFKSSPRVPISD